MSDEKCTFGGHALLSLALRGRCAMLSALADSRSLRPVAEQATDVLSLSCRSMSFVLTLACYFYGADFLPESQMRRRCEYMVRASRLSLRCGVGASTW